jgi:hypothetical protein
MRHDIIDPARTSSATTEATEPNVVAAISSAEGMPDQALSFHTGRRGSGIVPPLLLLAAAMALGFGAASWLRSRG